MKTIDLTLRQLLRICKKNCKNCDKCPLANSVFPCYTLTKKYNEDKVLKHLLMVEKVNISKED